MPSRSATAIASDRVAERLSTTLPSARAHCSSVVAGERSTTQNQSVTGGAGGSSEGASDWRRITVGQMRTGLRGDKEEHKRGRPGAKSGKIFHFYRRNKYTNDCLLGPLPALTCSFYALFKVVLVPEDEGRPHASAHAPLSSRRRMPPRYDRYSGNPTLFAEGIWKAGGPAARSISAVDDPESEAGRLPAGPLRARSTCFVAVQSGATYVNGPFALFGFNYLIIKTTQKQNIIQKIS